MTESIKPAFVWVLLGITLVGIGIFVYKSGGSQPEVQIIKKGEVQGDNTLIKVDVAGAVVKPGVYTLNSELRVGEAIIASGGLTDSADKDWVAKNLNQASKLTDGMKIYIPKKSEILNPPAGRAGSKSETISNNQISNQVSINSASQSELESLPGVGPVTAQKIISGRPYIKLEELTERKIVGVSVLGKIQGQITLW